MGYTVWRGRKFPDNGKFKLWQEFKHQEDESTRLFPIAVLTLSLNMICYRDHYPLLWPGKHFHINDMT